MLLLLIIVSVTGRLSFSSDPELFVTDIAERLSRLTYIHTQNTRTQTHTHAFRYAYLYVVMFGCVALFITSVICDVWMCGLVYQVGHL